jgi:hypothetical protein
MPLTTRLEIDDQTNGSNNNTWGDVTDSNLQILEQAIAGVTSIATTGGTTTLTSSQNRFPIIVITGTLVSNATINVRAAEKNWQFINATSGAFTVTVKTPSGSGQVLPRGQGVTLYCDGTNVLAVPTVLARTATSVGGTANAVTLTFSPAFSGFVDGMEVSFRATAANTGAMTIQCDLLAAKNFQMDASGTFAAMFSGAVQSGMAITAKYNLAADVFVWLNQKPVFMTAAQNVGIGAGPTYRLDVSSGDTTANFGYAARLRSNATATAATLQFTNDGGSTQNARITATDAKFLQIEGDTVDLITLGAIRQRIDATGKILQGTTTAFDAAVAATLNVYGGDSALAVKSAGTNNTAVSFYNDSGSARVGWIGTNGAATSYNTSSDYRLKTNVQPIGGALDVVMNLNPCTWTWGADGKFGQGFIAHELQEVIPDAVSGEKDGTDENGNPIYQGVDTSRIVATLTAAIQELAAEVAVLRARVNA